MLTEIYTNSVKSEDRIEEQRHAYRKMQDNIPKCKDKTAVLIQFSSQTSLSLVQALLEEDFTVTLHLQHPQAALDNVSPYQANRIALTLAELASKLSSEQRKKLYIHFYDTPASMNGVKIGNEKLIVGWYTHKRNTTTPPTDTVNGHDVPSLTLSKTDIGYEPMLKEFEKLASHYSTSQRWTLDSLGLQSGQHLDVADLTQRLQNPPAINP